MAPVLLHTTEIYTEIKHATRTPSQPFESPWLHNSFEDVKSWFEENVCAVETTDYFSNCFVILDEASAEPETCLMVNISEPNLETVRTDFRIVLDVAMESEHDKTVPAAFGMFCRWNNNSIRPIPRLRPPKSSTNLREGLGIGEGSGGRSIPVPRENASGDMNE